ncbi:sigma-70 family RNA polymerase sigma factor [Clostridium chrysemydis]|uniref:sigma-70 family RNA polymerase sigma factor n=1 Tax=Clostridium chrysemydis TaxID=2665504 RepID=UPI00188346BC|nr:sigma-70 family RNA polymerase sigma factor [Clostridium chrysemydis]
MKEDELIRGLINKEEKAFNFIVNKYGLTILKIIKSILKEPHEKDFIIECYDDTYMKALENISKHKKDCEFRVWIYTIAKYTALDYKRKLKRLYKNDELDDKDAVSKGVEDIYLEREDLKIINEIYKKLDREDQILFKDKFIKNCDTEYLKEKYFISRDTLYKRISRLRNKCRKIREEIREEREA